MIDRDRFNGQNTTWKFLLFIFILNLRNSYESKLKAYLDKKNYTETAFVAKVEPRRNMSLIDEIKFYNKCGKQEKRTLFEIDIMFIRFYFNVEFAIF